MGTSLKIHWEPLTKEAKRLAELEEIFLDEGQEYLCSYNHGDIVDAIRSDIAQSLKDRFFAASGFNRVKSMPLADIENMISDGVGEYFFNSVRGLIAYASHQNPETGKITEVAIAKKTDLEALGLTFDN